MKVYYKKGNHVIVYFPATEMNQALKVLKALAKAFHAPFIFRAAAEVEADLMPRLPYTPYYHLCEACKCEIDTRKDAYLHRNDRYTHQTCPVLKERSK
jgi:hypothetical protein